MRSQHQHLSFQNRSISQWNVHRHLVTVEVSVEGSTHQRMQLNCFSFDQLWLEKPGYLIYAVLEHGLSITGCPFSTFSRISQTIASFYQQFSSRFHCLHDTPFNHFTNDKWLEKFGSHIFRQSAFVQFHFRTYDDDRTARVINTFTEKVLTETTLLSFQCCQKVISTHGYFLF
jgi:hypothetical protein